MEVENEESVETPEVETPESEILPEEREIEETEISEVDDDVEVEAVDNAEAPAESKYEPNYTYRVKDDEFEMPDRIKQFIKSPEDEEYFRELLTAADGVHGLVQDRQVLRDDNTRLMQTEATRQQAVQQLQSFVQQGDLKPFMDTWGISDEQLARYMQKRINLMELKQNDPAQYAEYERNEQARLQSMTLQNQNMTLQQQNEALQVQQLEWQLDQTLNSQEFGQHAQQYDSWKGEGAFKEEVRALGDYYYRLGRGIVPPDQLAREVVGKWYGSQMPNQAPQQPTNAPRQGGRSRGVVQRNRKPTMANPRGSGGSPVKSTPKTFADLHRIREEKFGS